MSLFVAFLVGVCVGAFGVAYFSTDPKVADAEKKLHGK